jgi:hypothetical protein
MTLFHCECGNALFFENTVCLQCGSAVGPFIWKIAAPNI